MSRPVVANRGTATDELREGAIADLGVSGCIEALSLASAGNLEEDGPEFWADARQTRAAAKITNENAILRSIIENLQFGRCVLVSLAQLQHIFVQVAAEGNQSIVSNVLMLEVFRTEVFRTRVNRIGGYRILHGTESL
jgi:hypothetical protein